MCEVNFEQDRDKFTIEFSKITDKYISDVAQIRFELALSLHNGYLEPNDVDIYQLMVDAEKLHIDAKKRMEEDTVFLIRQHYLY